MHAFGLVETNFYSQAEKSARKALELNPRDIWATHAVCHVLEMEGKQEEGISFLSNTLQDWSSCNLFAGHCYWHWALYHMEKGDYSAALDIFDSQYRGRKDAFITDTSSLLFRLNMEGVDVADRWDDTYKMRQPDLEERVAVIKDIHLLLCLAKQQDSTKKMMESLRSFVSEEGTQSAVAKKVGVPVCEALVAYDEGDYARAVELMAPVRYQVHVGSIGGSKAQLDLFHLFLIHAAIKSSESRHHQLARALLAERKALKENSPMTDRMMAAASLTV
ncbi:tetratricopeptide repeat protein 38-like [Branchiostoma floridae x Branchiostoma japonicum]